MNKKILAAVFSMALLCSCGNGNAEELSEAGSESVSLASAAASETTVTTTSAETTSEAVSEETEIVAEFSETEENVPITRDFFNDDVVFEEVMLPVKSTSFNVDGTASHISFFEYDAAGNKIVYHGITYEYDYNPDGTYNSITSYHDSEKADISYFDENGYCIESTYFGTVTNHNYKYEYEFDETGRIIRKTAIYDDKRKNICEYTYDEEGRVYEEFENNEYYNSDRLVCNRFRHEYGDGFEKIYYLPDRGKEELWKTIEKDENGNIIKEEMDHGVITGTAFGYNFKEYKYDDLNRLVYEKSIYPTSLGLVTWNDEYLYDDKGRLVKVLITTENEEGENELKYKTREYLYNDDNGSMISKYSDKYGVTYEAEYAMIPKIVTGIEYKYYNSLEP
ncbi:MAG: hypothetical protein K2H23_02540 [Oscillospiraceae bacterium]|nr:hypothetical protein [Oscillospiraceae bacterium]